MPYWCAHPSFVACLVINASYLSDMRALLSSAVVKKYSDQSGFLFLPWFMWGVVFHCLRDPLLPLV
jgi:tryptophan-rich sensory protein